MWTNYHTHSNFCDGKSTPEEIVLSAIENKVSHLGFSSHAPFNEATSWAMKPDKIKDYINTINQLKVKYKNHINIYLGLEVDYIKNYINVSNFNSFNLDYTIGSVHFIDKYNDGKNWGIDGSIEQFERGLKEIYNDNIKSVIAKYYQNIIEMITYFPSSVLGHLDVIKKNNKGNLFFNEQNDFYKKEIKSVLDVIEKSKIIVEINTRGLYTNRTNSLYPSDWIIYEMLKRDIPIMLNSDAHNIDQIISSFNETIEELYFIGYRKLMIFDNKWRTINFNKKEIEII